MSVVLCALPCFSTWGLCSICYGDIPLAHRPELLTSISVPDLPERTSDTIPLVGWKLVSTHGDLRTWETKIPMRMRKLFYHRPPEGMTLSSSNRMALPFFTESISPPKNIGWTISKGSIRVTRRAKQRAPTPKEYSLTYKIAVTRENNLRVIRAKEDLMRDMILRGETRHGLYVPAPTTLTFSLELPSNAVFSTQSILLPPEVRFLGEESDGAIFVFQVKQQDSILYEQQIDVYKDKYENIRIDISAFSGKKVDIVLKTLPKENNQLDYVFLADPIIYTPKKSPRRIVILFIDTLRQDALSLHGYPRATSPKIDQWAEDAAVFSHAYSVSPWTLPAARSMLTGTQPEQWGSVDTIQEALAKDGWNTAFFAGNVYLSSTFGFERQWGRHFCENWPLAQLQIERAQSFIKENLDRDIFLMIHLMDMHLPYNEPMEYRTLFAPPLPSALPKEQFTRKELLKRIHLSPEIIKEYVRGRYDNNLRYIDDTITPFLNSLSDQDTVVLLSDHGEEFWEHDGFEHGHTLYEELIKVPFIIKSPKISRGIKTTPISLIDLAPTIADIAQVPLPKATGISLLDDSSTLLYERPLVFGRPLYGDDGWGTIHNGYKYTTRSAKERLYYLREDPKEQASVIARTPEKHQLSKENLSTVLSTPVQKVLRLKLSQNFTMHNAYVQLTLPQGFQYYWPGDTTIGSREIQIKKTSETELLVTWPARQRHCVEVFIIPKDTLIHRDMHLDFKRNDKRHRGTFTGDPKSPLAIQLPKTTISVQQAVMPVMISKEKQSYSDDVQEALKALGYQE